MGIFGNGKELKRLQSQVMQLQRFNSISTFGNSTPIYPDWKTTDLSDRYCTTDDVYSIIKRLATTSALIPIYPFYKKNAAAAKQLKHFPTNGKQYQRKAIELKALEDVPETDPVFELMESLDFEQKEAIYSWLYGLGEAIIYKERGEVMGTPIKFHVLYPQHVVLHVTRTWPQQIAHYSYIVDGQVIMEHIPVEDIIHIKYFNPNYSITGHELRGLSPIKVLTRRISRMDSEMDVSVSQLQNGGVPGIVYDKGVLGEEGPEIVGNRKDNFLRYIANKGNKGAPYFSGGELGYIPLGLKLTDMDVAALDKIDFKKLCNAYSVSDRLFNNDATGSEVSDDNARKALYTDACMPQVTRLANAFEKSLNVDFTAKNYVFNADVSQISELQEDQSELATWLSTAWWVTPNEKREMQKFDRLENSIFDEPVIPTGLMLLDDLTAVEDLPDPLNDYDNEPKI